MQVTDIDRQIADLQNKRASLIQQEHDNALKKAQAAVAAVNALGYSYKITGGKAASTGTRRTGIRDDVLKVVKSGNGSKPADIAKTLGLEDKAGRQSIANALSALKKAGTVTAEDGTYTAK